MDLPVKAVDILQVGASDLSIEPDTEIAERCSCTESGVESIEGVRPFMVQTEYIVHASIYGLDDLSNRCNPSVEGWRPFDLGAFQFG